MFKMPRPYSSHHDRKRDAEKRTSGNETVGTAAVAAAARGRSPPAVKEGSMRLGLTKLLC